MPSIEPLVKSWAEAQIATLGWQHGPEQVGRNLDTRVDEALRKAPTKSGGKGVNKPDHVIVIDNGAIRLPVLCEWKGEKGSFRDKKSVELRDSDNNMRFGKAGIDKYASLGAAYYASRSVGPNGHPRALALAVNGYFLSPSDETPTFEVALYVVDKADTEKVTWVGDYKDLSVLSQSNLNQLLQDIEEKIDPESAKLRKSRKSNSLDAALRKLNEFLHAEIGVMPAHRVNLVSALMIASLGVQDENQHYLVRPLNENDLYGGLGKSSDGNIILQRVEDYLEQRKPRIPVEKQGSIINALRPTLLDDTLSKKRSSGDSPLKEAFRLVKDGLLPHYIDNRSIDFTGKLFNEMYNWIDVPDAGANDVVLTPKKTTELMVQLTRINSDSYVWDWTLGTGAFLVSAMNTMLADARERYQGQELNEKENNIKINQLLGIERLGPMYVLAVLNMILMGDGSSNIIQGDAHKFNGDYPKGEESSPSGHFPATTLVLNPPYSAPGNGLIFVKEAFDMMIKNKTGQYGAVIIQDSAGSGKAVEYCLEILKKSTLEASIKMPPDLFIGKSGVSTAIYVFKVGTPHRKDSLVKFIDFSYDGFRRTNRKKVKDPSANLRPEDNPDARYAEVAAIVTGRRYETNYYPLNDLYFEGTIDPLSGNDWNFERHIHVEGRPSIEEFKTTVDDFLNWQAEQRIHRKQGAFQAPTLTFDEAESISALNSEELASISQLESREYKEFKAKDFFKVVNNKQLDSQYFTFNDAGDYPYFTRTILNNGIKGFVDYLDKEHLAPGNSLAVGMLQNKFFYMDHDFYAGQFTKTAIPIFDGFDAEVALYFISYFNRHSRYYKSFGVKDFKKTFEETSVWVPIDSDGEVDLKWIRTLIRALRKRAIQDYKSAFMQKVSQMASLI